MPDSCYQTPEGYFDEHFIYVLSPSPAGRATLSINIADVTLQLWTASVIGTQGNLISVRYVVAGLNTALSVSVVGTAIVVQLSTDGAGVSTTTAGQLAAFVNADPNVAALATLQILGVFVPDRMPAFGPSSLTGGADGNFSFIAGQDALNLVIQVGREAEGFICRRIAGLNTICTQFRYRDANGRNRMANPWTIPAHGAFGQAAYEFPVCPEVWYPKEGQIQFDLYGLVLENDNGGDLASVPISQIAFQGVRRFKKGNGTYQTPYRYREHPYTYQETLTIDIPYSDTSGNLSPTFYLNVPILNYDFELYDIAFTISNAGTFPYDGQAFAYTLYNAYNRRLSIAPVLDILLNETVARSTTTPGLGKCGAITPPVLYPKDSQIQLEIQSLNPSLTNDIVIEVSLIGVNRMPCIGGGYSLP